MQSKSIYRSWFWILQVCNKMSQGDWTIERDEDLTAPYAFMNNSWIAYEDPMSLKIKVNTTVFLSKMLMPHTQRNI